MIQRELKAVQKLYDSILNAIQKNNLTTRLLESQDVQLTIKELSDKLCVEL
jgi:hypothetical protein